MWLHTYPPIPGLYSAVTARALESPRGGKPSETQDMPQAFSCNLQFFVTMPSAGVRKLVSSDGAAQ